MPLYTANCPDLPVQAEASEASPAISGPKIGQLRVSISAVLGVRREGLSEPLRLSVAAKLQRFLAEPRSDVVQRGRRPTEAGCLTPNRSVGAGN